MKDNAQNHNDTYRVFQPMVVSSRALGEEEESYQKRTNKQKDVQSHNLSACRLADVLLELRIGGGYFIEVNMECDFFLQRGRSGITFIKIPG